MDFIIKPRSCLCGAGQIAELQTGSVIEGMQEMTHDEFRQKFVAAVKDTDWSAVIDRYLAMLAAEVLCGEKVAPPAGMADEIQRAFEGYDDYGLGEFDIEDYPETLRRIVYATFNWPTKFDQTTTTGQA